MTIRQPIVTVVGHVDHGKTTILDSIRSTCVAAKEAGGITQAISSTSCPAAIVMGRAGDLLKKLGIELEIPGFLFIDTPGHAAFTNLRKRGGALADLAILVVDINDGFKPQTEESIEILKENKIPFIVALNKIDSISGWKKVSDDVEGDIEKQSEYARQDFESKMYKIAGSLSTFGFDSDIFHRVEDFTKQIALVPCSGKKEEGMSELLVMLAGLAQKFLKGKLQIGEETKGTVLEVKKEKTMSFVEAIIYDGSLKQGDNLVIAGLDKPIIAKLRVLYEAMPLKGYKTTDKVTAATAIRMQFPGCGDVLSGMPFVVAPPEKAEEVAGELQKEISDSIQTDGEGIIAKADSLGSLEALMQLLHKSGIAVSKVGIGEVNKTDVISGSVNLREKPLDAVVVGFNVRISGDLMGDETVKIIANDVVYKLIEDLEEWREERGNELTRQKMESMMFPCKLKVLRYVFRQTRPAIFGVSVLGGKLKTGMNLMNEKGKNLDRVKAIQDKKESLKEVKSGKDVAISLPSVNYARQLFEGELLYSDLHESGFRKLKANKKLLTQEEIKVLQEIADIKRRENSTWGV
ncbi:translation initiation factor IF-2 [Nanoarchaeota archaeon]